MAFPVTQSFKRTTKSLRFEDDVLTKSQMLSGTNDKYSDGYMVVESVSHDVYIYDEDATPNQETGRFIKLNTGPAGGDDNIYYITIPLTSLTETDTGYTGTIDSPTWTDVIAELNKNPSPYIVVRLISDPSEQYKYILDIPIASNGTNKNASGGALTLTTKPEYTVVSLLEDANDKIKVIIKLGDLSGGGSLPSGGTTGQALVKKSNTDGDVERRTVQGLSNIVDMSFTQRSEEGETWTDSVTIKKGNSNNSYLEIKQNTENGNLLDVYITDNTVDVPHTLVSKYYADYNAGKIATIKVNGTEQTVANRTVDIKTPEFNVNVNEGEVNEATIINKANGQVKEIISFSKSLVDENCIQFHTETDNISDTPLDTHLTSKTYVDSKSPTIVNEGATFTNAQGNQQMEIRTGGTNSVIIKDKSANGVSEYWSYELPDKPYVDTEVAKRNAVVNFDNEYKTLQIKDVDNKLDFQVVKETSNDYVRMNEYAKDDRGQMQQIFDVKLPTKEYVDSKGGGVNMEVGAEKWYGTYTENNVTYQTYTKIVYIPALPSTAGITTYPMGVSNIKQILNIYGYTTDGFILNAPRQNVQDNISIYQVSKGSQTFSIEVGKDRSSKSAYVTIIYAKNN